MGRLARDLPSGAPDPSLVRDSVSRLLALGAGAVHAGGPGYPAILSGIPDPPAILFHRGSLEEFCRLPSVAVIGSRRASRYGMDAASYMTRGLARAGVGIVSGLARGIDSAAHRTCIDAGGSTAAVLGCGLDVAYPPEHAGLADEVAAHGVLLTEYPPGTRPEAYNFPSRNRLISGLSLAVLVVEAGDRSGTMITVDAALEQGRDVFAVPGEISRPCAKGTNRLLREGAMVATCPEDMLEALGICLRHEDAAPARPAPAHPVAELLTGGALHFDELCRLSGTSAVDLQGVLLELELSGAVVRRPGGFYSLPPGM